MIGFEYPDREPAPEVENETTAQRELRDLVSEIEYKLGINGHVLTTQRWTDWTEVAVTTANGQPLSMVLSVPNWPVPQ